MKRFMLFVLCFSLFCVVIFSQELGEIKKGTGNRISFNRISIIIPIGWNYSVNPRALPGTDQLQLYSDDKYRTLLITLTKSRSDITLEEAIIQGGRIMVQRALSFPGFEKCFVGGSGQNDEMWGRKGIYTKYILYKDENHNETEAMMHIYNYGENILASKEVLLIGLYIIGEEKADTDAIIKTLEIIK
ncbi:MAG: hypothetical protein EHM28_03700 [Spirochaetaceae bacterium]|nr:MAG: hypothetical protein EHM28_03700 [Spirochaetaceae bacterium]